MTRNPSFVFGPFLKQFWFGHTQSTSSIWYCTILVRNRFEWFGNLIWAQWKQRYEWSTVELNRGVKKGVERRKKEWVAIGTAHFACQTNALDLMYKQNHWFWILIRTFGAIFFFFQQILMVCKFVYRPNADVLNPMCWVSIYNTVFFCLQSANLPDTDIVFVVYKYIIMISVCETIKNKKKVWRGEREGERTKCTYRTIYSGNFHSLSLKI